MTPEHTEALIPRIVSGATVRKFRTVASTALDGPRAYVIFQVTSGQVQATFSLPLSFEDQVVFELHRIANDYVMDAVKSALTNPLRDFVLGFLSKNSAPPSIIGEVHE